VAFHKQTLHISLYIQPNNGAQAPVPHVSTYPLTGEPSSDGAMFVQVSTMEVEYEIPDDFDWRQPAIGQLRWAQSALRAKTMEIEDWIGKFQALEAPGGSKP
jgi:hypothetical protein